MLLRRAASRGAHALRLDLPAVCQTLHSHDRDLDISTFKVAPLLLPVASSIQRSHFAHASASSSGASVDKPSRRPIDRLQQLDVDARLRAILWRYRHIGHEADLTRRRRAQDELQLLWVQLGAYQRDQRLPVPPALYWATLEAMCAVGLAQVQHFATVLDLFADRLSPWQLSAAADGLRGSLIRDHEVAARWLIDDASIDSAASSEAVTHALNSYSRQSTLTASQLIADFRSEPTHSDAVSSSLDEADVATGIYQLAFCHAHLRQWSRVLPLFRLALAISPSSFPRCQRLFRLVAASHNFALLDEVLATFNSRLTHLRILNDSQRSDIRRASLSTIAFALLSHPDAVTGAAWLVARLEAVGSLSAHMLSEYAVGHVLFHLHLRCSSTALPSAVWTHLNDRHYSEFKQTAAISRPSSGHSNAQTDVAAKLLARLLKLLPVLPPGVTVDEWAPLSLDSAASPSLFFTMSYFESRMHHLGTSTHLPDAIRLCELCLRTAGVASVDLVRKTLISALRNHDRVAIEALLFLLLKHSSGADRQRSVLSASEPPSKWSFQLASLRDRDPFPVADFHLYVQMLLVQEAMRLQYDRDDVRLQSLLQFFVQSSALPVSWRVPSVASDSAPAALCRKLAARFSFKDDSTSAPFRASSSELSQTATAALASMIPLFHSVLPASRSFIPVSATDLFDFLPQLVGAHNKSLPFVFTMSAERFMSDCLSAFHAAASIRSVSVADSSTLFAPQQLCASMKPISISNLASDMHPISVFASFTQRVAAALNSNIVCSEFVLAQTLQWAAQLHSIALYRRLQSNNLSQSHDYYNGEFRALCSAVSQHFQLASNSTWGAAIPADVVSAVFNVLVPVVASNSLRSALKSHSDVSESTLPVSQLPLSSQSSQTLLKVLKCIHEDHSSIELDSVSLVALFRAFCGLETIEHASKHRLLIGKSLDLIKLLSSASNLTLASAFTHEALRSLLIRLFASDAELESRVQVEFVKFVMFVSALKTVMQPDSKSKIASVKWFKALVSDSIISDAFADVDVRNLSISATEFVDMTCTLTGLISLRLGSKSADFKSTLHASSLLLTACHSIIQASIFSKLTPLPVGRSTESINQIVSVLTASHPIVAALYIQLLLRRSQTVSDAQILFVIQNMFASHWLTSASSCPPLTPLTDKIAAAWNLSNSTSIAVSTEVFVALWSSLDVAQRARLRVILSQYPASVRLNGSEVQSISNKSSNFIWSQSSLGWVPRNDIDRVPVEQTVSKLPADSPNVWSLIVKAVSIGSESCVRQFADVECLSTGSIRENGDFKQWLHAESAQRTL